VGEKSVSIPTERIEKAIILIRDQKVMIDRDLAELYGVETRVLNQAVRRNKKRFPPDFMFPLTREEIRNISQIVICSGIKHARNVNVFTEQGVAMLSSILNSDRAIEVNIAIMRAFVELRRISSSHKQLAQKLREIEARLEDHDESIDAIFEAIQQLLKPPEKPRKRIGFEVKEPKGRYGKKNQEKTGMSTDDRVQTTDDGCPPFANGYGAAGRKQR